MEEKIKIKIEQIISKLEKRGLDDITDKEERWSVVLIILLNILLLILLFFLIPFKIISIPIVSVLFLLSLFFILANTYVPWEDLFSDKIILIFGIITIPISLLVYSLIVKVIPYRGDNKMLIRKYKLKTLRKKVYIKKLKFWE